ncbi:adenosylcobinamide-GDP ribazoletransferase [Natronincola ferrireducens]|uniref:Adenosylcobinamide-GDP ribazoletransferase n=1 Tax=Natronincola ferrireducens TaxID=393762 RepID=A0A1G9E0P5_9FIRM|nr:adenosylcobinamide-GDP ribazoletransferase [Natronincola ferrireducens]SDK69696.1 cobalamin-5'-phosphate synthase [Natronincola ferrireducens]
MQRFLLILQFLTRITVIQNPPYDKNFEKGIVYFPVVGLVLGLILAAVYRGLLYLLSPTVASILVIAFYVALTGGLHLDGLGDTFDGFYSSRSRETILEIMKDSRLGTNGVVAIFFCLTIKIFGIASLSQQVGFITIMLMPVFGRLALVYGCYKVPYGRQEGLGHIFINRTTKRELIYTIIITVLITLIDKKSFLFIVIAWVFASLFKNHSKKIIHGMTGDTLGGLCELTEILYILYILVLQTLNLQF